MNKLFLENLKLYFDKNYLKVIDNLNTSLNKYVILNTLKDFNINDLDIKLDKSIYSSSCYTCNLDSYFKSKAFTLGLIYPQDIASSYILNFLDLKNKKLILDLCSAPGGKAIDVSLLKDEDAIIVCNDINYNRLCEEISNFERLGIDNVIFTNKKIDDFLKYKNMFDLVIVDAPCSGEGMVKKYSDILENYSQNNIDNLSNIQKSILDVAYSCLKNGGNLLYSTCTFSLKEDEDNVDYVIKKYKDIELIDISKGNKYSLSQNEKCLKFAYEFNGHGQFISYFRKIASNETSYINYLKDIKIKEVDNFLNKNLNLDVNYYTYNINDRIFLSFDKAIDFGNNVVRNMLYIGDIKSKNFIPSHSLFRSNKMFKYFKYRYDLNDEEYKQYVQGLEIQLQQDEGYYLVTYKHLALGYCKLVKNRLKNKYPKGLRYN